MTFSRTRIACIAACVVIGGAVTACASVIGIGDPSLDTDEGGTAPAEASSDPSPPKDAAPAPDARVDSAAPSVRCNESGAQRLGQHCYFVLVNPSTQGQARLACAAVGAHLVTITSDAEQSFIRTKLGAVRRWIGLEAPPSGQTDKTKFTWITGEPVTYSHWEPGEPNGDGPCVALDGISGNDEWDARSCTAELFPSICERE